MTMPHSTTPPLTTRRAIGLAPAILLTVALGVVVAGPVGCSRHDPNDPGTADSGKLLIKGSDTLVELIAIWAETYGQAHPATRLVITGGGTGTGFAAMFNGTTDLIMASRPAKAFEIKQATLTGNGQPLHEIVCARDALAIVVHQSNPVPTLSVEQLRAIYSGKITNWRELGGPDAPVVALSRDNSSGTYAFFEDVVLKPGKATYSVEVLPQASNVAITGAVARTEGGIGYVGLAHIHDPGIRAVPVQAAANKPAVAASVETSLNGTYPLARPLYLYTRGQPRGLAAAFVEYALSTAGQRLAVEAGYVPVKALPPTGL